MGILSEVKAPKVLDNKTNFVYTELKESIKKGSKLSVISALFSMYAYDALKKDLDKIDNLLELNLKLISISKLFFLQLIIFD